MALDPQTYLMHRQAYEGKVFYEDNLTEPEHVRKYFPPEYGQMTYDLDPKLSFPITSNVINRLASIIHGALQIDCENEAVKIRLEELYDKLNWHEFSRNILVMSLSRACYLVTLRTGLNGIYYETWAGEYIFRELVAGDEIFGYMYLEKDGELLPIYRQPDKKEMQSVNIVTITQSQWGGELHSFGFTPAVLFNAVDKIDSGRYAKPFYLRYRDMNIRYNQLFSGIIKDSLILKNVWNTNKDIDNPDNPIRIATDMINFLGQGGTLEQAVRNLNIEPELSQLDRIKDAISEACQMPSFMTGLRDVGKVESGVALNIISAPLIELCMRIKSEFVPKIKQLLTKTVIADYMVKGESIPVFDLQVKMSMNIMPIDKEKELNTLYMAVEKGIVTPEEARIAALPLLGLDSLIQDSTTLT